MYVIMNSTETKIKPILFLNRTCKVCKIIVDKLHESGSVQDFKYVYCDDANYVPIQGVEIEAPTLLLQDANMPVSGMDVLRWIDSRDCFNQITFNALYNKQHASKQFVVSSELQQMGVQSDKCVTTSIKDTDDERLKDRNVYLQSFLSDGQARRLPDAIKDSKVKDFSKEDLEEKVKMRSQAINDILKRNKHLNMRL